MGRREGGGERESRELGGHLPPQPLSKRTHSPYCVPGSVRHTLSTQCFRECESTRRGTRSNHTDVASSHTRTHQADGSPARPGCALPFPQRKRCSLVLGTNKCGNEESKKTAALH